MLALYFFINEVKTWIVNTGQKTYIISAILAVILFNWINDIALAYNFISRSWIYHFDLRNLGFVGGKGASAYFSVYSAIELFNALF